MPTLGLLGLAATVGLIGAFYPAGLLMVALFAVGAAASEPIEALFGEGFIDSGPRTFVAGLIFAFIAGVNFLVAIVLLAVCTAAFVTGTLRTGEPVAA